jgi:hypothetical protein
MVDGQSVFQRILRNSMESAARPHVHRAPLPVPAAPATIEARVKALEVMKASVKNIHAAEVSPPVVIPGEKRLPEAQRAPAKAPEPDAESKSAAIP